MAKSNLTFNGNLSDYWSSFNRKGIFKFFKTFYVLSLLATLALLICVVYYVVFSVTFLYDNLEKYGTQWGYMTFARNLTLAFIVLWLFTSFCASFGKFYKRVMGAAKIRKSGYAKKNIRSSAALSRKNFKNASYAAFYGTHTLHKVFAIIINTLYKAIHILIAVLLFYALKGQAYLIANLVYDVDTMGIAADGDFMDVIMLLFMQYVPVIIVSVCYGILKMIIAIFTRVRYKHWLKKGISFY